MATTKTIFSICIPGYKEENRNVGKMLANLRTQIPAGIIIAEYDPDFKSRLKTNYPGVNYVCQCTDSRSDCRSLLFASYRINSEFESALPLHKA